MSPIISSAGGSGGAASAIEVAYVERTTAFTGGGVIFTTGNVACTSADVFVLEFFCPWLEYNPAAGSSQMRFQVSGVDAGRAVSQLAGGVDQITPFIAKKRITGLSAGNHTFGVNDASANGASWTAGDGVTTDVLPMYLQVLKVG